MFHSQYIHKQGIYSYLTGQKRKKTYISMAILLNRRTGRNRLLDIVLLMQQLGGIYVIMGYGGGDLYILIRMAHSRHHRGARHDGSAPGGDTSSQLVWPEFSVRTDVLM